MTKTATRDPFTDPKFGDVFRFVSPEDDYPYTIFLRREPARWWGLDVYPTSSAKLDTPRVVDIDRWVDDGYDGWEWVLIEPAP